MTPIDRLREMLAALSLTALDARLESLLEQAAKSEPSYAEFLLAALTAEVEARRQRYLKTRLQLAHLPYVKTFEQFDFGFQPSIDERQVRELRTLRFVHDASNVILLGPPGVGKTHLAVALAEAAIRAGQAAYFRTAHDLVDDLGRAYREGRLDRRLKVYLAPKVLVIDEMGYLPMDDLGATIFFQLVSARYERGSIILTSNKSYGDWGGIFGDPIIATAILDRLLHYSTTMNIRGESYRLKDRRRAPLRPGPPKAATERHGGGEFWAGVDMTGSLHIRTFSNLLASTLMMDRSADVSEHQTACFAGVQGRPVSVRGPEDWLGIIRRECQGYLRETTQHPVWTVDVSSENAPPDVLTEPMLGSNSVLKANTEIGRIELFTSGPRAASEAIFLVTDLCRWEAACDRIWFIHGGAVQGHGVGTLIVGAPRGGKTILAMALLAVTGGQFVGDNNIAVVPSGGHIAVGWPTPVTIRRSAIGWIERLFPEISFATTAARFPGSTGVGPAYRDIVELWPSQLRAADIDTTPTCRIGVILFPTLAADRSAPASVNALSSASAADRLRAAWDIIPERRPGVDIHRVLADGGDWNNATFHRFTIETYRSKIQSLMEEQPTVLAEDTPCFKIEFGEDSALDAAKQVLDRIVR